MVRVPVNAACHHPAWQARREAGKFCVGLVALRKRPAVARPAAGKRAVAGEPEAEE